MIDKALIQKTINDLNSVVAYLQAELIAPPPPPPPPDIVKIPVMGSAFVGQQWNAGAIGFAPTLLTRHRLPATAPQVPWRLTTSRAAPGVKTRLWADSRYDFSSLLYFPTPTTTLKNGKPKRSHQNHQAGVDPASGISSVINQPLRGGAQGSAVISPYITMRGHKSGGTPEAPVGPIAFFWVADKVGFLNADGTSKLVAGRIPKDDMALFDPDKPDDYFHWVGQFPDGFPSHIVEGSLYEKSRSYFFLSDFTQGVVWKIDRGETPESRKTPSGWIWKKHVTGLVNPVAVQDLPDGRLFVVDDAGLHEIDFISGATTLLMPMPQAFFLRATSKGTLVAGDLRTQFVEFDPIAKTKRVIKYPSAANQWLFGDISPPAPHDFFVPADTIIYGTGTGVSADGNNNGIYSLALDGTTGGLTSKVFDNGFGAMPHGLATEVQDVYGHYPWLWAFHPELSIAFSGGIGSSGVVVLRPAHADDKLAYDTNSMSISGAGLIMRSGVPDGWPIGVNPSFTATWGPKWATYCALTPFELVQMGKQGFIEYIRSDKFDGVTRPELGQLQVDGLWYWVNACNLHGVTAGLPMPKVVPPANKAPPIIRNIRSDRQKDSIEFFWETDVPAVGFVYAGQSFGAYYRARKEDAAGNYKTTHSAVLEDCKVGRELHFIIGAQSAEGYLATSANMIGVP